MYCKHCGRSIDDNSVFCTYCGKSVQKTQHTFEANKITEDSSTVETNIPTTGYEDGFFFKGVSIQKKVLMLIIAFICCVIIACITFISCYPENIDQLIGLIIQ